MNCLVDTHVLIWRYLAPERLSPKAKRCFAKSEARFLIPAVSILETQYLVEIGRIELDMDEFLETLKGGQEFKILPFDEMALIHSLKLTGTRDPFDRMILGQALSLGTPILTRDRWMKKTAPDLVIY